MIYTTVLFQVIQVREFGWSFQLLITDIFLQAFYSPGGLETWLVHMAGTNALLKHCYHHASATNPPSAGIASLLDVVYRKVQIVMMVCYSFHSATARYSFGVVILIMIPDILYSHQQMAPGRLPLSSPTSRTWKSP